jgi:hypothetical protein
MRVAPLIEDRETGNTHDTNGNDEPIQLKTRHKSGFVGIDPPERGFQKTCDRFSATTAQQVTSRCTLKSSETWTTRALSCVRSITEGYEHRMENMTSSLSGVATFLRGVSTAVFR